MVEEVSRRDFIKMLGRKAAGSALALTGTGLLMEGCSPQEFDKEPPFLEFADLTEENLKAMKGETIRTTGFPFYVGEKSIMLPSFTSSPKGDIRVTFTEKKDTFFRLCESNDGEGRSVYMAEKSSGLGLSPISHARDVEHEPTEELLVTGRVEYGKLKIEEGTDTTEVYFLRVTDISKADN